VGKNLKNQHLKNSIFEEIRAGEHNIVQWDYNFVQEFIQFDSSKSKKFFSILLISWNLNKNHNPVKQV